MASHIERRKFLAAVGSAAAAWPLAARAQQSTVPVIGFLDGQTFDPYLMAAFREASCWESNSPSALCRRAILTES
jgi:hypothetical protein